MIKTQAKYTHGSIMQSLVKNRTTLLFVRHVCLQVVRLLDDPSRRCFIGKINDVEAIVHPQLLTRVVHSPHYNVQSFGAHVINIASEINKYTQLLLYTRQRIAVITLKCPVDLLAPNQRP